MRIKKVLKCVKYNRNSMTRFETFCKNKESDHYKKNSAADLHAL